MKPYTTFYFESITFDKNTLVAHFEYSFDQKVYFTEKIDFSSEGFVIEKDLDKDIVQNLLFHLSLALGISYYKLYPTDNLVIKTGIIDEYQQKFWKNFYLQGLGEFFFTNGLSPEGKANFSSSVAYDSSEHTGCTQGGAHLFSLHTNKALLPIGGGKDSLVSAELLNKMGIAFDTITFGKYHHLHETVAKKVGAPKLLIKRTMDPKLFEMNQQGYYNGHVPITGIISFVLVVVAYIYDYRYVVFSNEKSADYGNIAGNQQGPNHQYSKSHDAEKKIAEYITKYLSPDLQYFSLLKGMYESKIISYFAQLGKKYFDVFSSCNTNFKILASADHQQQHRRCNACPKCAFVYSIMRPYLTQEEVLEIFGEELYEKTELLPIFSALLDPKEIKPFECVGTQDEVLFAMRQYIIAMQEKENQHYPYVIQQLQEQGILELPVNQKNFSHLKKYLLSRYDEHTIPKEIGEKLKKILKD